MKKQILMLLAVLLCLSLCACSAEPAAPVPADKQEDISAASTEAPADATDAPAADPTPAPTQEGSEDADANAPDFTSAKPEELFELLSSCYYVNSPEEGVKFDFAFQNLTEYDLDSLTFSVRMLDANGDPCASNFMSNTAAMKAQSQDTFTLDHNVFSVYPTLEDFTKEYTSIEIHKVTITPDTDDFEAYFDLSYAEPIVLPIAEIPAK